MNPINYKDKLTIIIVSFHSNHIIENLINQAYQDLLIKFAQNIDLK